MLCVFFNVMPNLPIYQNCKIDLKIDTILCAFLKPSSKRKQHQKCSKIDSKMELKMLIDRLRSESRESVKSNNTTAL